MALAYETGTRRRAGRDPIYRGTLGLMSITAGNHENQPWVNAGTDRRSRIPADQSGLLRGGLLNRCTSGPFDFTLGVNRYAMDNRPILPNWQIRLTSIMVRWTSRLLGNRQYVVLEKWLPKLNNRSVLKVRSSRFVPQGSFLKVRSSS
jgi:hypothetical protein